MSKLCKSCGAPMEDNAVSCSYCGARDESAVKVTPAAEVIAKKQFCTKCGNELIPGKAFCATCGASTDRTKPAQTAPTAAANYRQPTAQQPNYVNRTMPAYAAAQTQSVPKKKGHGCLIAFICVFLAIALLITGFVYPGFFIAKEGGDYTDMWKDAPGDNVTYVSSGKVGGKSSTPKPLKITDCSVDIPEGAVDGEVTVTQKGSGVSITVDGNEDGHAVLKERATVRLTLDKPVADESLDKIFVYYVDEDGEPVYYRPSRSQLENGVIEFSTVHFSFWDSIEVTDQKEAEILAKELARKEFATEMTAKDPDNALIGFFNTFYESIGITDDTVKGKLIRDAVGRISDHIGDMDKNDLARSKAAQELYENKLDRICDFLTLVDVANKTADGDVGGLMGVMETLLTEQLCENFEVLKELEIKGVAGAVMGAVPVAIFNAAETGDWSEAAIDVVKAGVVKAVPIVGYVQTAAGICEYVKDQWYDGEKEDWYRDWSRKAVPDGKGGYVIDSQYAMFGDQIYNACEREFDIRYKEMYYSIMKKYAKKHSEDYTREEFEHDLKEGKLKNILTAAKNNLYKEFAQRKKYEDDINRRTEKYRDMILAFKEFDSATDRKPKLTVREKNGYFNDKVSMYDRLNKLMAIRTELVIFLGGEEKAMKLLRVKNSHDLTVELSNYIQSWLYVQGGNPNPNAGREYVYELLRSLYGDDIGTEIIPTKPKETTTATEKPKETTTTTAKPKEAKYAWVRVDTDTHQKDNNPKHDTYSMTFGEGWAEELYTCSATSQTEHRGYGGYDLFGEWHETLSDNSADYNEPKSTINADDVVKIKVSVKAKSNRGGTSSEVWASWEPIEYDGKIVDWGYTLGGSDFKRADDDSKRKIRAVVDDGGTDTDSGTLQLKIGAGSEGCSKYAICLSGPGGGVRWIYEWKQVG